MSFQLVLSSVFGSAIANTSVGYNVDWRKFEQGSYSITFAFCSNNNDVDPSYHAIIKMSNLNVNSYVSSNGYNTNTNILGLLYPTSFNATDGYLSAKATDNLPIIINELPTQNMFTINVVDYANVVWLDKSGADLSAYTLILNFTKLS